MPINASPEYGKAEKEYLNAQGLEDQIYWLEEMIRTAPKHKGSENLLAGLRTRLKKFREKSEKAKKKSGGRKGIKKEGFQFVMVGKPNSGKSSLLNVLTNANSRVGEYDFTTTKPEVGTFNFEGVQAQIIDIPSIGSENFDVGLVNNADCLLIIVEDLRDILEVEKFILRSRAKKLVVVSKTDRFDEREIRKLEARMKSKRIDGVLVSSFNGFGIEELKQRLFVETGMIRVYLKEPGKPKEKAPMVLENGSTVKDVAEDILKGFSLRVKEVRLTGPSGKFPNQRVGLSHIVKDKDVVEFRTK